MPSVEGEDIEQLARNLRVSLGIHDQLQPKMIDVLQRMKHRGCIVDYVRVPDDLLRDAEARYNPDDRKIHLRESTYRAAERAEPHARWTIAHEIGHVARGHKLMRNRSALPERIERIAPTIRRDESEAHQFAAAFLAPFHRAEFSLDVTAQQLAHRFGISLPAAVRRLEELTRLYRRHHGLKRPLPPGIIDFFIQAQQKGYKLKHLDSADLVPVPIESPKYEGELCPCCNNFKMVRTGTSMKCDFCGAITGGD